MLALEAGLYRERTWEPEFSPLTADLVAAAISQGVLTPEEVSLLLVCQPDDPQAKGPGLRLLLFRLQTEGAPVQ